jgi:hypothetical protein
MDQSNRQHRQKISAAFQPCGRLRRHSIVALLTLVLVALCAPVCWAQASEAPALAIDGLGKGLAPLDGPWQFHLGDDPAWAAPALDDVTGHSGWEQIAADKPWGSQGHLAYAGYAWYRRHLKLSPAPGAAPEFSLLIPHIEDVYEIYWNGTNAAQSILP